MKCPKCGVKLVKALPNQKIIALDEKTLGELLEAKEWI